MRRIFRNHLYPVHGRAGSRRSTECDMCPETTFARWPAGPDQGGPWGATCFRKPPIPGATQGRIKVDHGVGVSSTRLGNTICGTQFVPECSRICSRGLASGTKMFPTMLWNTGFLCVFAVSGTFLFPNVRLVFPILFPTARPWNKKCSRLPVPPGPDQGGPRSARCTRKPPFTYAP